MLTGQLLKERNLLEKRLDQRAVGVAAVQLAERDGKLVARALKLGGKAAAAALSK